MDDHGGINRFVLVTSIVVLTVFHCIIWIMKRIYKVSRLLFSSVFIWIAILILLFYLFRIRNSWDGWIYGLKGRYLINDGIHCNVPIPTLCELGIRNNWIDFNRFTKKCNENDQAFDKSILNKNLRNKEGITLLGFPRTEWSSFKVLANQTLYRNETRSRIIDMNDPNIPQITKDSIEFTLDISNPK